jgi:hypothetical protein
MLPSVLPLISETDYPAFQRRIADLANITYEEWTDGHAKAIAYRRTRNGSIEIAVNPVEFDLWLVNQGKTPQMELLWVFAEEKAAEAGQPALALHH